jgi:hypothetical protein
VQQYCLKESAKVFIHKNVNKKELIAISYSQNKKEILWEDDAEFTLRENLYDVVYREKINGDVFLYCLDDKKETQLVSNYLKTTKENSTDKKNNKNNFQQTIYFCETITENNFVKAFVSTKKNFYKEAVLHQATANSSPPPKYFC